MILAVDIGNTDTVFGVYDSDKLTVQFRIQSDKSKTTDEYTALIVSLFDMRNLDYKQIEGVIIGSVVPSLTFTLSRFVSKYLNVEPLVVGSGLKTGISLRMENPKEVGADRIANAVGAVAKFGAPCIVVDFGTATTFDIVNKLGEYIGGVICPGVKLAASALHMNTAKLPEVDIKKPSSVIGKNTTHSMQSGIYYGYLEMMNGLLERIRLEEFSSSCDLKIISTGGLARLFTEDMRYDITYEPHLTLDGLRIIYEKNIAI